MIGKTILSRLLEAKKLPKPKAEVKLTPEQQTKYDEMHNRLSDRGGMSFDMIHRAILSKLGIKPPTK
jgi:hypothetical protein